MKRRVSPFIALLCIMFFSAGFSAWRIPDDVRQPQDAAITVNEVTLAHVRRAYPDTMLMDDGRNPYFKTVNLIGTFALNEQTLQVLWISRGRTRHAEVVIIDSAGRVLRKDRGATRSEVEVIDETWLRFRDHPLVRLSDASSLDHFLRHGRSDILAKIARSRVKQALEVYLAHGRAGLLEQAPRKVYGHPWEDEEVRKRTSLLPERIQQVEFYPSLAEDFRLSEFKYSSPWEGTVLVRVSPLDPAEPAVILEIGASGWAEGIHEPEVELLLWEVRLDEPTDRPAPQPQ